MLPVLICLGSMCVSGCEDNAIAQSGVDSDLELLREASELFHLPQE